jgi:hypothetical protein
VPADRARGGFWRSVAFVVPLALIWLIPLAVLMVAVPQAQDAEQAHVAVERPDLVPVGARATPPGRGAAVQLTFTEPADVTVRRAGIVTSINATTGSAVGNGSTLIGIGGVPVLVYQADVPLFRDLGRGDRGPDVQALGGYLSALGLMAPAAVSTTYGSATEQAVRRLEKERLGIAATGRFSVGNVAFVPASATTVKKVGAVLGADVAIGDAVVTVSGAPTSVAFLDPASGERFHATVGGVTLQAGERTLDLGSLTAATPDGVYAFVQAGVAAGSITPLAPTTGQDTTPGEVFNGITVLERVVKSTGTVPATAVYTTASGVSCVFVSDRHQAQVLGPLDLVPGQLGVVVVSGDLVGNNVVRNPQALDAAVLGTCA